MHNLGRQIKVEAKIGTAKRPLIYTITDFNWQGFYTPTEQMAVLRVDRARHSRYDNSRAIPRIRTIRSYRWVGASALRMKCALRSSA